MANQEHEIKEIKVFSDGGTAGHVVFELAGGGKATISASIEQPVPEQAHAEEEVKKATERAEPTRRRPSSKT